MHATNDVRSLGQPAPTTAGREWDWMIDDAGEQKRYVGP